MLTLPIIGRPGGVEPPEETLGDRIRKRILELGTDIPAKPEFGVPDLPNLMTDVSAADLGNTLGRLSSWAAYLAPQAALARSAVASLQHRVRWAKNVDRDVAAALILEGEMVEAKAFSDVLEEVYKATMRKREACSREITRHDGGTPEPSSTRG